MDEHIDEDIESDERMQFFNRFVKVDLNIDEDIFEDW